MKINISKSIKHSLLIEEADLKSLCQFIAARYRKINIYAKCIDGTKLETTDVEDVLSFENPNYRKIKSITIRAKTDIEENLSINIQTENISLFLPCAEFEIESDSDEQALYISQEIIKKFSEMKPWYDFLARISISYTLLGIYIILGLLAIGISVMMGTRTIDQNSFSIAAFGNVNILVVIFALIVLNSLDWIQRKLFPKVFFLLGKQKKSMEILQKWRSFVFGSLFFTIVIGVVVNAISNWLFK